MTKPNKPLIILVEGAIMVAIAMALSFIPSILPNAAIDLSWGLIPMTIYSLRRGVGAGLSASLIWGLLHFVLGKTFYVAPWQVILEYTIAFAVVGLAGLYSKKVLAAAREKTPKLRIRKGAIYVVLAAFTATFARWFCHYWAGVYAWGIYAPEGQSPYLYSLIMNGTSFLVNAGVLLVVLLLLLSSSPVVFKKLS
jgi:thiamine transporter